MDSGELIVVEDRVDMQCMRHVHWMSNSPTPLSSSTTTSPHLPLTGINGGSDVQWVQEAGAWHLRAVVPFRGVLDVHAEGWVKMRRLVAWSLVDGGQWTVDGGRLSVREGLREAWRLYVRLFGGEPRFAFMRRLPRGVENCVEVGGMVLLEAEWMLERCVAVGGRGA